MFSTIQLKELSLILPHKTCFADFSINIYFGEKIAIIGCNGSGKSTLLKMLREIFTKQNISFNFIPQIIEEFLNLSGGERFNAALTKSLAFDADILLLDEPTNHLDLKNRKSILRVLKNFCNTLIIATHDLELLNIVDKIWHIDNEIITVFSGSYDDYKLNMLSKVNNLQKKIDILNKEKQQLHNDLMQEQKRAKNSKAQGRKSIENRKWPTITSNAKAAKAEQTSGNKKASINCKKENLSQELQSLRLPAIIIPKFFIENADLGIKTIVNIQDGAVGYKQILVKNINLSLLSNQKLAIIGDNGSGKTTLLKALMDDSLIIKEGMFYKPAIHNIGYIDQHYNNLSKDQSILQVMENLVPDWSHANIRKHLNDFLFRKNEEVNAQINNLSGGEKARLSLALIAAKIPQLLILDEITNNLDLETKEHVIQVLKEYPGAMIVISHEESFLQAIGIDNFYEVKKFLS